MLQKSTFDFLRSLSKNNNREWFEKNRGKYESAKEDFEKFVGTLLTELSKVNPGFGGLQVKDCVFRIYRDVRFSKNKDPYKTNMGGFFVEGGKKSDKAGFYVQIAPGNCFIAAGSWMPPSPLLKKIRQEIDYNLKEFDAILKLRNFKKYFDGLDDYKLKTTPKGYDSENPAIEYLRQTGYTVSTGLSQKDFLSKDAVKNCVQVYKAVKPFTDFLNTALD